MGMIGIDLGTTNSVATVYNSDGLKHISFDNDYLLPSVVNISENGVIVGRKAKNMAVIAAENTSLSIKRKMGSDEKIILDGKVYTPQEISSLIIKKIKETAQNELGRHFTKAVVTVPAYFNEKQREATAEAVKLAGLELKRLLNEPTAAALSYGVDKNEDMVCAVYDLGGGTFDISVIENSHGLIEVLATAGNNYLGGDDFDKKLSDLIWEKSGFDLNMTKKMELKLMQVAESAKIELSSNMTVNIDEKFFAKKDGVPLHLEVQISKDEFEELISEDIDKTIELLLEAVDESGNDIDDLDSILLTGGSSRIPMIAQKILEQTGKLPILIEDPDKSVSIGAALQGAIIEGHDTDSILVDITPYSLGTSILNDDGMGFSLSKIIFKNTPVPTQKTSRYYATMEYQSMFEITVYQGEDEDVLDNNVKIGDMLLKLEEPAQDGVVDITFSLDQDGILAVRGVEINTGESIQGEFKTKISKSTNHSKINEMEILNEHDKSILLKIDDMLNRDDILEEDKNDLKKLKSSFLSSKGEEKAEIEEEIIDTIFFLEE
jgi:molecular chaperone DnaK